MKPDPFQRDPEQPGCLPDLKVLIADEHAALRILLKRVLEKHGYKVTVAATTGSCLHHLESGRYHLVLLGSLPAGDGELGLLHEFRRRYPAVELPVIVMTGSEDAGVIRRALAGGANECVTKPLDFTRLLSRIRTLTADPGNRHNN